MVATDLATADHEPAGVSSWPAPAKLNVFLRITGRRSDGFHDLQTVFQLLHWGDSVQLRVRADGAIRRSGGDTVDIPKAHDLIVRAASVLQASSGCPLGVDMAVTKRIPRGGGFGGGSSDAATVLVALNQLWHLRFGVDELARLGLKLGADVPLFVHGRNAWAEGAGEQLTPVDLPPCWYLLVFPGVAVETRAAFADPELTRDAPAVTIRDFVSGVQLGNAFEPVVRRLQPAVDAVLKHLSQFGQAHLTGTGSGCFLRFQSQGGAEAVRARLQPGLDCRVVAAAAHSPLLDAVAAATRLQA